MVEPHLGPPFMPLQRQIALVKQRRRQIVDRRHRRIRHGEQEVVDHLYFGGQQLAAQQMADGMTPAAVPELLEPLLHLLTQAP